MLKARGAHVTGVDAGPKLDLLRSIGADQVVDYTRSNFIEQGVQYDLILDVASNLSLKECRRALKPAGLYVWIGHEHFGHGKRGRLLGRSIPQIFGIMARSPFDRHLPKMKFPPVIPSRKEAMESLRELMEQGKLKPFVEKTYPLESVTEAFRSLEAGKVLGKVDLVI
jgi:NADPH:quinone reductase-like Zn-dependent oxidoreductase